MEKLMRVAMPLDMADTPDDVVDFLIRVTRLKIEDLEGEIIGRTKQLADMKLMLNSDPQSPNLNSSVATIESIIKIRLRSKRMFKAALEKLHKAGNKIFADRKDGGKDKEEETKE